MMAARDDRQWRDAMRTIRLQTHVDRDHTLRIELPSDVEEGPAEVIVLVPDRRSPETIEEILPLAGEVEVPDLEAIAHEIDDLYREITRLVGQGTRNPNRQQAIRSLRKRLRELQEQEADAMELHFRGKMVFDPRQGRELMDRARRILDNR
jgi:hypothetical protein